MLTYTHYNNSRLFLSIIFLFSICLYLKHYLLLLIATPIIFLILLQIFARANHRKYTLLETGLIIEDEEKLDYLSFTHIKAYKFQSSILGAYFDYGTLILLTKTGEVFSLRNIDAPLQVMRQLKNAYITEVKPTYNSAILERL